MNTTQDTVYKLQTPEGVTSANELSSGKLVKLPVGGYSVAPGATIVLYFSH